MRRKFKNFVFGVFGFCLVLSISGVLMPAHAQQQKNNENIIITNQSNKTLTIYPVPVSTSVHIRISQALRPDVDKLEIINLIGRKITEQTLIDATTTDVSFSNLGQYPSGIYMVVARDKYGKIVKSAKMVINH
ncbi:MAG TPA: T9SS type A sorting domain-containing protein [Edaphocola sp.]|nr:T9SS type A sorting domain-containing protein [Edaphocola sp.]